MTDAPTERTRAKRMPARAKYDADAVHAILDAQPICNVGYVLNGAPVVTPTLQWREGDHIYWHGSSASRMLETSENADVCVSVSIIDGFVLARSAYNHSCNYRSVMVFGKAFKVTDVEEKRARLKAFTEALFPGRWDKLRPMSDKELKATMILGLTLDEASAKIRTGSTGDEPEDVTWPVWGGVIPVVQQALAPEADAHTPAGMAVPDYVTKFRIG